MYVTLDLNMQEAQMGYTSSPETELRRALEEANLFNEKLIYRAISGSLERISTLKSYGVDHPQFDSIFALSHEEVFVHPASTPLFEYIERGDSAVIAVYRGESFTRGELPKMFEFTDPSHKMDTLVAIMNIIR